MAMLTITMLEEIATMAFTSMDQGMAMEFVN